MAPQLLHHAGTQIHELVFGCQEHRIQSRIELVVDQRHLKFLFKIGGGPQALYDHIHAMLPRVFGQQLTRTVRLNIGQFLRHPADHSHTFLRGKHRFFFGVDHHAHDQPVKDTGGALDDVEMPPGDRVKAAGINRRCHYAPPFLR